jgi:lysophospholipase L1-like esterase
LVSHPLARLWLTALAQLAIPLLVGFAMGHFIAFRLRRRHMSSRRQTILHYGLACGALLLVMLKNISAPELGFWDALAVGMALGTGVLAGTRGWRPRLDVIALVGAATVLSLVLAEVATRIVLPHAPSFPPPETATVTLPWSTRLDLWTVDQRGNISGVCRVVFGPSWPWTVLDYDWRGRRIHVPDAWERPAGTTRVVLHIGDSMVYGEGVKDDEMFTAVLGRSQPTTAHVNAGISGTGPQEYLAIGRAWIPAIHPDLVVTYFFVGNDIDPVLAAYPCCDMQELYTVAEDGVQMRCPSARPVSPHVAHVQRYIRQSPPPLALRLLTGPSKLARYVAAAMIQHAPGTMVINDQEAWRRVAVILRTMRDDATRAGARFALVVLPLRSALLHTDGQSMSARSVHDRVVQTATDVGIVTLDAWDLFEDAVRRTDEARWFASEREDDPHFSAAGHQLLADWLAPRLDAVVTDGASGARSALAP